MTSNSVYAVNDSVYVNWLALTTFLRLEKSTRTIFGVSMIWRMPLSLDQGKEVRLAAVEVRVCELSSLGILVGAHEALLEGRDLAEAIEVELTDERGEVLVLEPFTEDFAGKLLLVKD